jgi:primosomal protein N'
MKFSATRWESWKQREQEQQFELTPEQTSALDEIRNFDSKPSTSSLLLWCHRFRQNGNLLARRRGDHQTRKQAIILVPEIALTPQAVRRFLSRFPGQVGLVHSKLSEGERYDTWRRARDGKLNVIIGARSALFSPLPNIGLIVVDECHDSSYYQSSRPTITP